MEPGFSESTFSHALYGEMLQDLPCFRAPYFPSTIEESWVPIDMEWSLNAQRSLFVQFKVSQFLDHPRAAERNHIACPYFRFRLHHSLGTCTQHNLLRDLSDTFPDDVFYVAPMFHKYDEYNQLYVEHALARHSIAIKVALMSWFTDAKRHCVAYNLNQVAEFSKQRDLGSVVLLTDFTRELRVARSRRERPSQASQQQTLAHLKHVREILINTLRARAIEPEIASEIPTDYKRLRGNLFSGPGDREISWDYMSRVMQLADEVRTISLRYFGAYWIGLG